MRKFLFLIALIPLFGGLAPQIRANDTLPTEDEIVEVEEAPQLTQDELDKAIEEAVLEFIGDGYQLVIGFWETFTAIVGISGIGAIIGLAIWLMRKFGVFNKHLTSNDEVVVQNSQATEKLANDVVELKKVMLAFIAVANVDGPVKARMLEYISDNKSIEDYVKVIKEAPQEAQQETEDLLAQLSRKV